MAIMGHVQQGANGGNCIDLFILETRDLLKLDVAKVIIKIINHVLVGKKFVILSLDFIINLFNDELRITVHM